MIDTSVLQRHGRIALCFSGGKDSLACIYLLRKHLDRLTVYHNDTGETLPEISAVVEHVKGLAPHFVHIHTDVAGWIAHNGMPSDLVPFNSHPIGVATGESGLRLVSRYECCYPNLMRPVFDRIKEDGATLVIRGTKRSDLKRLPAEPGETGCGFELWLPLLDWSDGDVLAYLRDAGAPVPRLYNAGLRGAPDCATCPAWWSERRAHYLKEHYPDLWREYHSRLAAIAYEIDAPLRELRRELLGEA